jgi:hypothetical protein
VHGHGVHGGEVDVRGWEVLRQRIKQKGVNTLLIMATLKPRGKNFGDVFYDYVGAKSEVSFSKS